jgi:betaine-aldehyde dehydrogenase
MWMARRFDYGCVRINTHVPLVAKIVAQRCLALRSSCGKDLSMYGLEDYTRVKHVMTSLDA